MSYEPIKTEFQYGGDDLKQITRDGDWAVYSRITPGIKDPKTAFEVVIIQRREEKVFEKKVDGKVQRDVYPPAEVYPSSSQWGLFGWTYMGDEAGAIKYMRDKMTARSVVSVAIRKRERIVL